MVKNFSVRTWVLMGFVISVTGIILNVFVVSNLNNKIREAETELSNIRESLRTQAAEISRADLENDLFTILNHISRSQTGEEKTASNRDAVYILQNYLKRVYTAANDIPANEVLKVENEQMADEIQYIEKVREAQKKKDEGSAAEAERLLKAAEDLEKSNAQPKSELDKKLKDAVAAADPDKLAEKDGADIVLETIPSLKAANEQFIASFQKKEARIKELEDKRENLSWWTNTLTLLAVSMQMFGLLCVLNKDLPKSDR